LKEILITADLLWPGELHDLADSPQVLFASHCMPSKENGRERFNHISKRVFVVVNEYYYVWYIVTNDGN
jgi:hypothetical protein